MLSASSSPGLFLFTLWNAFTLYKYVDHLDLYFLV